MLDNGLGSSDKESTEQKERQGKANSINIIYCSVRLSCSAWFVIEIDANKDRLRLLG